MFELTQTRDSMIEGALKGKEAEWEKFYPKYRRLVVYLGKCLRLSDLEIEELTSRVMVKFWERREKFQRDPGKKFRGYFASMVHTVAMDMFREKGRRNEVIVDWPTDDEGKPMEFAGTDDIEKALQEYEVNEVYSAAKEALQRSVQDPVKYQCWQLRYEEKWPVKKIVEYLDVPQSTVYWNSDALAEQLKSIYCELTGEQPPVAKKKAQDSEDSSGKHLNREEIQQYIFEECGFLLRHRIETHLKKCPECVALIEEARKTRDLQQKILQGAQKHVSSEMEVEQSLSHFQDAGRGFPKR